MRLQSIIKYISKFLEPTRVFIALMLAVGMWLFPFISFKEKTVTPIEHGVIISAVPFTAGAIGECSNVRCDPGYCCQFGYCVIKNKADCGQDDPPPPSPPTISANLNCSNWGDNGWCKGSLSIDLSAADPQGQAVVISGAVNGNNFACPSGATSCSIPLSGEGTGSVSYQVNSATGLSAAGSLGYQIDLTSPNLDTSVSGAGGTNGWYRSDVTLGVSASDATSGIASITASINGGGATSVGGSLTFSNGEYSVLIVARDNAGHVTQDTQTIKVDTITPSLSFTSSGTNGKNGWYVSSASAAATASDVGSGLASIEASVDGGTWVVSDSISLGDGVHTYQFRATDVAGNKTETPTQTALVDTIAPSISMSQGTSLGEKVLYEIEDYGSGLSIFRAVIEDDDEAYQKVTWSGDISGSYIADDILWDGKFADGARAGIGEYMVTLKITDAAGNKAIKATFVTVGLLDLLDDIPAFSPPVSSTSEEDEIPTTASTTGPQTFGGIPTTTNAGEFISTTTTVSGITIPTTNIPLDPNILWGAAATAMVGATLADWQKKREEEARRKAEAQEEKRANTEKRWGQKKAEDAVRQRWAVEKAAEEMAQSRTADSLRWAGLASVAQAQQAQDKAAFDHRMGEHTGEQDKVDAWKGQQADAARWAGLAAMEKNKEKANSGGGKPLAIPVSNDEPKWWEKITNAAVDAWQSTKTIVSDAFIATGNGISAIYKAGRQQTTDFLNVTKNQALGFWNDTKTTFSDLGETIKKSSADSSKSLIATFGEIPNYVTTGLNNFFSYQYDYHGPVHPPTVTPASQLLMPLPGISPTSPKDYILKNYQITQYPPQWPSRNECVTTATIQDMNMMQDILSSKFGVPQLHHMDLPTFTNALDGQPLWALRPPANVPIIGGMLPPQSATAVLEGHSMWLRETYGYGYTVKLTSYNTVDDLIENLQNGYPTSLHISQSVDLHTDWRAIIGGAPHTVTLAGYDSNTDHWLILDPANSSSYTEWSTPELMDKWGRQFLFYPPRFAMTTLIPDSMDASP